MVRGHYDAKGQWTYTAKLFDLEKPNACSLGLNTQSTTDQTSSGSIKSGEKSI